MTSDSWSAARNGLEAAVLAIVEAAVQHGYREGYIDADNGAEPRIEWADPEPTRLPTGPIPVTDAITAKAERLDLARRAIIDTGYFTDAQVTDDVAPRIREFTHKVRELLLEALILRTDGTDDAWDEWTFDTIRAFPDLHKATVERRLGRL